MKKLLSGFVGGSILLGLALSVNASTYNSSDVIILCAHVSRENAEQFGVQSFGRKSWNRSGTDIQYQSAAKYTETFCNRISKSAVLSKAENIENTLTIAPQATIAWKSNLPLSGLEGIKQITYNFDLYYRLDNTLGAQVSSKDVETLYGTTYRTSGETTDNTIGDFLPQAIQKLYDIGATKYKTPETFMASASFSREQAAKFFVETADAASIPKVYGNSCYFKDKSNADPDLRSYINQACLLGIMKGSSESFYPKSTLTIAEATTIIMRLYGGKLREDINPWYTNYFKSAFALDLFIYWPIKPTIEGKKIITRGEAALMIYKYLGLINK